jgi:phosphatase NudJ
MDRLFNSGHAPIMREPIPMHMFVLVVAFDGDQVLMVQERDGTWYLPAGRVEPGENLVAAAVRETLEEAAQLVGFRGILGIDHAPFEGGARMRFVFSCYRGVNIPPKDTADEHSLRAGWFSRDVIAKLPLRHPEVLAWIDRAAAGAPLLPTGAYDWIGPAGSPRYVSASSGVVS